MLSISDMHIQCLSGFTKLQLCRVLNRIKALLDWLGDSARVALQKSRSTYPDASTDRFHSTSSVPRMSGIGLPTPAVVHVHVVATILWKSHEFMDTFNVKEIITKELLRYVVGIGCYFDNIKHVYDIL